MPVKTCLSSILSTRFDFGVPLEDVFPPNDIHPRLKYLFGKAYESYVNHGRNVEVVLQQGQGSMKERLGLKEKLVLDLDYHINIKEFSPGTYFWVLRHFLGLLPLPLLPKYAKDIQFSWNTLADDCRKFLQNCDSDQKDKHVLDYEMAQTINMLPFENFILLNMVLAFLRKLSTKTIRGRQVFNRKSMVILSKYYCSSMFVRPFRPGYFQKDDLHLPLLLYLILRWQKISKHCEAIGHPAFFLESDIKNMDKGFGQRDSCIQTNILDNAFFNPEVISVCRNIPYFVNICNNYFKDIGCQTDLDLCNEKNGASCCTILEESGESDEKLNDQKEDKNNVNRTDSNNEDTVYKLAYIEEELDNLPTNNDDVNDMNDNTLYQTATDLSFKSALNKDQDWKNIVRETVKTVRKVEESYIYDDYETFKKEDFNQIANNKSRSFLSKITKYGFTYSPSKNVARQDVRLTSTPEKKSSEIDTSYIKYPDVCEDVDLKNHNNDHRNDSCHITKSRSDHDASDNIKPKQSISQKLFQDNSPIKSQTDNSKQNLQNENGNKKRKKYVLRRIRLSLEFLRALTPKKSTFKRIESRVKYSKIKNSKSNTI